jgi:hypothetical protein
MDRTPGCRRQTGPESVLADKAHDAVENPSAVALGRHGDILGTSAAYFGQHPALQIIGDRPDE